LLPLAYDIALDCRSDPLLEPSARADMDWLIVLLGGDGRPPKQSELLPTPEQPTTQPEPQPVAIKATELIQQPRTSAPTSAPQPPARQEPPPPARHEPPAPRPDRQRAQSNTPTKKGKSRTPTTNASRKGRPSTPPRRDTAANNGAVPQATQPPIAPPPDDDPLPPLPSKQQPLAIDDDPLPPLPPERPAPAPAPALVVPNANAMIERMRLLRQQREKQEPHPATPQPQQRTASSAQTRFNVGNTVFCLPYGEGVVRESRIEDDSEILEVAFPEYGTLTIDPAVSLVRLVEGSQPDAEDTL
jgi:DEAD/DEAH box helicase domain-containing protein